MSELAIGEKRNPHGQIVRLTPCVDCGKERWVQIYKGKPVSLRCRSCANRVSGLRNVAENHPQWKGGEFTVHGYVYIRKPNHPHASNKYIKRSIVALEEKLGRYLLPHCYVHHLNGDRGDDRPENLIEVTPSEHTRLHSAEMNKRRRELCQAGM